MPTIKTKSTVNPTIEVLTTTELQQRVLAAEERRFDISLLTTDMDVKDGINRFYVGHKTKWDKDQVATLKESGLNPAAILDPQFNEAVLTPDGFKSLLRQLNYTDKAFDTDLLSPGSKVQMLRDILVRSDKEIRLRGQANEDKTALVVDSVLSGDYPDINNQKLAIMLNDVYGSEGVPPQDEIFVSSWRIDPKRGNFHARFISPLNWTFDMNSGSDPYFGTVIVDNNDKGQAAFKVTVGVYRLFCLNYAIGVGQLFKETHKFNNLSDFKHGLQSAFRGVTHGIESMKHRMLEMQSIEVAWPEDFLDKVLGEAGFGRNKTAKNMGLEYMSSNLPTNRQANVYDVFNALTHAVKQPTMSKSRSANLDWRRRMNGEEEIWKGVDTMVQYHIDGGDIEELYQGPEAALKDAISAYIGNRANQFDDVRRDFGSELQREVLEVELG